MSIMEREENLVRELISRFNFPEGNINIKRDRRIFAELPPSQNGQMLEILKYLRDEQDFAFLCTITGLDMGDNFQVIYHLSDWKGIVLSLKLNTPRSKPVIQSVIPIFEGAVFYERELNSLFGIEVSGLPAGRRYPLPDGWPEDQYPLRKDWRQSEDTDGIKS
jgi:NADH:ubiquinone oxidoreductase subunit C